MKQTAPTNSSREALAIGKTAIAEGTSVIGMITGHPTGMRKGPRSLILLSISIEIFDSLFSEDDAVTLEDFNHRVLGKACEAHRDSLKADYKQNDFVTNGGLNFPAIAM
jgi:hypothetical protein